MSRIHEALKKAAQERTLHEGRFDVGVGAAEAREASTRPRRAGVVQSKEEMVLRLEDLEAHCVHTDWKTSDAFEINEWQVAAEGFRTLRSRLHQIAGIRSLRRILVTSSQPGEGKTFVATNLARSSVRQSNRRVLLIDADLRAGDAHTALGAPNGLGLADFLTGDLDEHRVIQKSPDSNLYFMPCGSNVLNPSDVLLSDRMKTLLGRVTPLFDWVILDSPPILTVHDASGLADLCDGVVFVVKAGVTEYEAAEKACAEFRSKNLLGIVLNQVDESEMQDSYYGYPRDKR